MVFGATDIAVVAACYVASAMLWRLKTGVAFPMELSYVPLYLVAFAVSGLYPGFCLAPAEELRRYTVASLIVTIAALAINTSLFQIFDGDEGICILAGILSLPALWACRVLARAAASRSRLWGVPAVVFGSGKEAHDLVDRLLRCRWIGYHPFLIILDEPRNGSDYRKIPVVYGYAAGLKVAAPFHFSTALVALPGTEAGRYRELLFRYAKAFPTFITFSDLVGITGVWAKVRDFEGVIGLSTKQELLVPFNGALKRVVDFVGAILLTLAATPFCLLMAALIKIDSPGPIFYRHQRLGRKGKEIRVLKFRTMVNGADKHLSACFEEDPALCDEWNQNYKLRKDPRVTRVGRFLRATSLDELPQLWNVLKGEMSLIGPRPIVKKELRFYGSAWEEISSVPPGMSGLWQVSGRSDAGYARRVELDTYYIQNWSVWLDVFIFAKTLWIVITRKGAR